MVALCATLIVSWSIYALGIRPHIPAQSSLLESLLGAASRTVFWLLPCALYLWRYWGWRWAEPIGFGFPLGAPQVLRTVTVTLSVSVLLVLGTAVQKGLTPAELMLQFWAHAGLNLQAPLFEEFVFRGVIVSELLNWLHDHRRSRRQMHGRFWGVQWLGACAFLLIHWPWWLSQRGLGVTLSLSPPVLFTGLILGVVFANTRSIWGCVFLHWLNNELSVLG